MATDPFRISNAQRAEAEGHVRRLVARKQSWLEAAGETTAGATMQTIGIVGAGLMGTALAAVHAQRGLATILVDTDAEALRGAPDRVRRLLVDGEHRLPGSAELGAATSPPRLQCAAEPAALARCDLVLESIVEKTAAKKALYRQLETELPPEVTIGSNTSTIPIGKLALELDRPGRFCGVHFFHPVGERRLVEIIPGKATELATTEKALCYARAVDKLPIVVADGPGFLVNRLLLPLLTEALELLLDGASLDDVQRAALDFGMAKGPFTLLDEIGLDTALSGGRVLWEAFPERILASPLLISMVKKGRLGCKTGAGFFEYPADGHGLAASKSPRVAPETLALIGQWARQPQHLDRRQIAARLLLPMVLEGSRLLGEGVAREAGDVDLGAVFGLGFPTDRGGPLFWADRLGPPRILQMLEALAELGPRFAPTAELIEMAESGRGFYGA